MHTIIYLFSTWLTRKAYFCVCRTYAGRLVANARSEPRARREVSSFSNHSTCTSHALARPRAYLPLNPALLKNAKMASILQEENLLLKNVMFKGMSRKSYTNRLRRSGGLNLSLLWINMTLKPTKQLFPSGGIIFHLFRSSHHQFSCLGTPETPKCNSGNNARCS